MRRRPLPAGLLLPGHLILRHADAQMLHDEDETLDLLAQTAGPDEGLRHQHRRAIGLTLQRQSNMLQLTTGSQWSKTMNQRQNPMNFATSGH